MKVRFHGAKAQVMPSAPPGVIMTFRPGEAVVVDAGFSYLRDAADFEMISDDTSVPTTSTVPNIGDDDGPDKSKVQKK